MSCWPHLLGKQVDGSVQFVYDAVYADDDMTVNPSHRTVKYISPDRIKDSSCLEGNTIVALLLPFALSCF
jgi:hypothetical protein